MIDVNATWRGLDEARAALKEVPAKVSKANVQALNRAIASVRTLAVRTIRQEVALPAGYVRERLVIRRASAASPEAKIVANRRGVLLSRFPHRELAKGGVRVTITPGRPVVFKRAFLVHSLRGSGATGIAVRKGRSRLPIDVLHGPSVSQVFGSIRKDIAPEAAQIYRKQFQSALLFALGRGSR